ncbi:hypothetical protein IR083_10325 [Dysgonomonas sp. GY75]|uniref:hypothetical protein n=1 Tax=Dysgonomonas sp. GY75 TaxID=2780419 RepID=UPI00188317C4|nr:hypothetical protein [Dysgonomonas sp. GY75]MBF0649217.1 hypothetical protein [Dysgonomonas sp. GY75]
MNTNIFDKSNVEVLNTNEDDNFIYESYHVKALGRTFKARTKKTKLKSTNETIPQIHIEDFIVSSGLAKEANKEAMEAFLKTPAIKMQRAKIEVDNNSTWMDIDALIKGLNLATRTPNGTELSWNVRGEGLLYIAGLISVTDGAILANFLFNDHQFSSIAETSGVSNILLNGEDGSGHLAAGNISWNASGDLKVVGTYRTSDTGARIEIDPTNMTMGYIGNSERVFSVWKATNQTVAMDFFTYTGTETNFTTRSSIGQMGIDLLGSNFVMQGGKMYLIGTPTNRNDAEINQVYLDGETLKVRKS